MSEGNIVSRYGLPNTAQFSAFEITYFIKPKQDRLWISSARPILDNRWNTYEGLDWMWNGNIGFRVQDVFNPSINFPTTGFHNAFFDLDLQNDGNAGTFVIDKEPTDSVIEAYIENFGRTARVHLTGPSYGNTGGTIMYTTFRIYSKPDRKRLIYSFCINKWFIAKSGNSGSYNTSLNYCNSIHYRMPAVNELTNAKFTAQSGLPGGTRGGQKNYTRYIGGGLLAEWGDVSRYYPGSNFIDRTFWKVNEYALNNKQVYGVYLSTGVISLQMKINSKISVACVLP